MFSLGKGAGCFLWVRERVVVFGFVIGLFSLGTGDTCCLWIRERFVVFRLAIRLFTLDKGASCFFGFSFWFSQRVVRTRWGSGFFLF